LAKIFINYLNSNLRDHLIFSVKYLLLKNICTIMQHSAIGNLQSISEIRNPESLFLLTFNCVSYTISTFSFSNLLFLSVPLFF